MTLAIRNLQLIYGVAGAREAFEGMCSMLIKNEYPNAHAIRVFKGDGGVDQTIGDWNNNASPVTVFQQKYFIDKVAEAQKSQIRESYRTAANNKNFTLDTWIICLPINLATDEKSWFDKWKSRQPHTIELWDELKLTVLLLQAKNQAIKEQFFREEYLHQIREIYNTIMEIAANLRRNTTVRRGRDYDAQLFQKLTRDILGSKLLDLFDFLFTETYMNDDHFHYIAEYRRWANDPSNEFILPALNNLRRKFDEQFIKLRSFMGANYFPSDLPGDNCFFFQPDAKSNPKRERFFRQRLDEYDAMLKETRDAYYAFVREGMITLREHGLI
ncbi:MAG TPA: hypothetical protein VJ183_20700 [Chloroflexia bacterium]|nr:hypothetical protein [Chloroflexia bacterium]